MADPSPTRPTGQSILGWGVCPDCPHPQHTTTPCYRQMPHGRCACPAHPRPDPSDQESR